MQAKTKIKDYPPNVPRKLFKLLRECKFNRSCLALKLGVNSGYLSKLLNRGEEPPDTTEKGREVRKKLFLKVYKQGRKKINRTIQKQELPDYQKKWNHLSREERHKIMRTYIEWKDREKND